MRGKFSHLKKYGWDIAAGRTLIRFSFTPQTAQKILEEWDSKNFKKEKSIWLKVVISKLREYS